jgi:hypothetical protein
VTQLLSDLETAIAYWKIVFGKQFGLLDLWCRFLQVKRSALCDKKIPYEFEIFYLFDRQRFTLSYNFIACASQIEKAELVVCGVRENRLSLNRLSV